MKRQKILLAKSGIEKNKYKANLF